MFKKPYEFLNKGGAQVLVLLAKLKRSLLFKAGVSPVTQPDWHRIKMRRVELLKNSPLSCYAFEGKFSVPENIKKSIIGEETSLSEYYCRATHLLKFLKQHVELKSTQSILEIGCGWGMLALVLFAFLDDGGQYIGLDVNAQAIAWAKDYFKQYSKNIEFHHTDVANSLYNPKGEISAETPVWPVQFGSVDLVYLGSVFTHMRKTSVIGHLKSIRRVLKGNGTLVFSYLEKSIYEENLLYGQAACLNSPDNTTYYSSGEIVEMLKTSGFAKSRDCVHWQVCKESAPYSIQTVVFAKPIV